MPGVSSQNGLWPAFWLMGNLGRATFIDSTDGIWPFSFDSCLEDDNETCTANSCRSQKISACDDDPGYGLKANQGRGSPEIDVLEVMPGASTVAEPCGSSVSFNISQPLFDTSLQIAPGFPVGSDQRPDYECLPATGQ
eukprot:2111281-Prymnesium_polylepis.1